MDFQEDAFYRSRATIYHNNSRPSLAMHQLSQDVLVIIFSILRDYSYDCHSPASGFRDMISNKWDWIILTHVCRYWRATALEYPPLWSVLPANMFTLPQKVKLFLDRSKRADLTIDAQIPCPVRRYPADENAEWEIGTLTGVLQQIERIKWLSLHIRQFPGREDALILIQDCLTHTAPKLRKFHLFVESSYAARETGFHFGFPEFQPLLTNLRLINVSMKNAVFVQTATCLVKLVLKRVKDMNPVAFLSMLDSCPDLQVLAVDKIIWDLAPDMSDALQSFERQRISLPKLSFISVIFNEQSRIGYNEVLRCLDIPPKTSWICWCSAVQKESLLAMDFHTRLAKANELLLCDEVCVWLYDNCFVVRSRTSLSEAIATGGSDIDLDLDLILSVDPNTSIPSMSSSSSCSSFLSFNWQTSQTQNQVFNHINSLVGASYWKSTKAFHLDLSDYTVLVEEGMWKSFLLNLSSVQTISLKGDDCSYRTMESFSRAFAHQNEDTASNHTDQSLSPRLEHLSLEFSSSVPNTPIPRVIFGKLQSALKSRKQIGSGLKSVTITELPRLCTRTENLARSTLSEFVDNLYI